MADCAAQSAFASMQPATEILRCVAAWRIGATLHQRFVDNYQQGMLLTPARSAASLLARLPSLASGQIWDASDPE